MGSEYNYSSFYRLLIRLIKPDILALGAVLILYALIFWSVDKGVSVDEGFYLLGYLDGQNVGPYFTDFHNIVRAVLFFIEDDNVLGLRIARLVITILSLILFTEISFRWLNSQHDLSINRLLYFSLSLLAGTMCFSFASNTPYYDNIQLVLFLLSVSLWLIATMNDKQVYAILCNAGLGILVVIAMANYIVSGIFLLLFIYFFTALFLYPRKTEILLSYLFFTIGIAVGILLYSWRINSFWIFITDAIYTFQNFAKAGAKYDSGGQAIVYINFAISLLKIYLPALLVILVYFLLYLKTKINKHFLNMLFIAGLVVLTYKLSNFYSIILFLPIVLFLSGSLLVNRDGLKSIIRKKEFLFFLALIILPIIAIAGTNQKIEMKMVFYMPFWFLAYVLAVVLFEKTSDKNFMKISNLSFIVVFFIVFAAQGFIKHIHFNYSIKRSTHRIENASRFNNIGVSEYQCNFYDNGIRELTKAGFKPGDDVLAFYETFMLVYAAGGYVPHRLSYSAEYFTTNTDNIPPQKPNYIIIDDYQVPMLKEFLVSTDWNFPASYNIVELGTDGHNLTQLGYNYLLFYSEDPQTTYSKPQTN